MPTSLQLGSNDKRQVGHIACHLKGEVETQLQSHAQSLVVDSSPTKLDDFRQNS